jgi:hypothetical protein
MRIQVTGSFELAAMMDSQTGKLVEVVLRIPGTRTHDEIAFVGQAGLALLDLAMGAVDQVVSYEVQNEKARKPEGNA